MEAPKRIYLSPPHLSGTELEYLRETLESNWIAPLGPQVDAFEQEFTLRTEVGHAAALSSGTAALHLALRLLGVEPGDRVVCSNLTFVATANAIRYVGAEPVFIDSDETSWNLDPQLLEDELEAADRDGRLPKAAIVVDLYGQSAHWRPIREACARFGVPIVEDAAEALGATYGERPVGGFGRLGVFSFNGNKIITTSGGGMLVGDEPELIERAQFLAAQARDPAPHYEHSEIGYNYRMSNLLAAVGRAQLATLDERVEARRQIYATYCELLGDLPGLEFMPDAAYGRSTRWITCAIIDESVFGASPEKLRLALEAENIEARPIWKPMHLQPLYENCHVRERGVSERLFRTGLCLPSGTGLSEGDLERVAGILRGCHRKS